MNRLGTERVARLIDEIDEVFGSGFTAPFRIRTFTLGSLYDPERYELIERKDYLDQKIKDVEEDIATLERNKESTAKYYDNRIASLRTEKERLQNQKKTK